MENLIGFLQENEKFQGVPVEDLEWLQDKGSCITLQNGDFLWEKDQVAQHLYILLEGQLRVYGFQKGQKREFGVLQSGDVSGVLPYSRMTHSQGFGESVGETQILRLDRDDFPEMISEHHGLTRAFVHLMTTRIRNFTTLRLQNEKLLALGKISAGLAHELNNPASAIVRSATSLREHLKVLPENFKAVIKIRMEDENVDRVNEVLFEKINGGIRDDLSVMQRTEQEDEIVDWLEESGVEDPFEISENLVDFGFTLDNLDYIRSQIPDEHWIPVLIWIENNLTTEKMVLEISEASERIARLVKSVKEYSHMDQNLDKGSVDVHKSLRSTLRMFEHRWKKANITIVEDFDESLPEIVAFPGELKQVWTNLIDNAIDAMDANGGGQLTIKTHKDRDFARIDIEDNGSGIPADALSNIFDPFFTTKEIGKGTGLGLDVVMKIMRQHKGDIKVESAPGRTVFKLCFPIQ